MRSGGAGDDGAGCDDGCAGAGCLPDSGVPVMTFVGDGRGDYITTTTYTYVGHGAGDLAMGGAGGEIQPTRSCVRNALGVAALLLLAALACAFSQPIEGAVRTTTVMAAVARGVLGSEAFDGKAERRAEVQPQLGECLVWGDLHAKSFDGARPSYYGEGEFFIVKSETVVIQGRFRARARTKGLAATEMIVIGGPFLHGHTVSVASLAQGDVAVDDEPVLTAFPSKFRLEGLGSISYDGVGELVDDATADKEKRVVHIRLPLGVELTVFRWGNYLDLRLVMPPQPRQDGACGNFNGDPEDDATQAVMSRIGAQVPDGEFLFRHRAVVRVFDVEDKLLQLCPPALYEQAKRVCPDELRGVPGAALDLNQLKSCYMNVCFGSNEHIFQQAKSLGL